MNPSDLISDAPRWTIEHARTTYNIPHWGEGYFDVNAAGHIVVRPDRDPAHPGIDLYTLAAELRALGLGLPILIRCTDILRDRIDALAAAFAKAMHACAYQARYTAVYPIKVNQQRSVVERILQYGGERVGLEAGSKPELMAVLALSRPGGVIICNGYKDREYIRLALIGQALGHKVYIVLEKRSELERVLEESAQLDITPLLGVRVRLASIGAGKWQNTGGEKSKFGLSAAQTIEVVEYLQATAAIASLKLLHFHLGSQIANIRDLQRGLREGARYYAALRQAGADIRCVDVGGGLGVDYEGTRSRSFCSINYSIEEYARNVVQNLAEVCAEENLPQPELITESGRAMTAHHALLLADVIDSEHSPKGSTAAPNLRDAHELRDLARGLDELPHRAALEIYHDATQSMAEVQDKFLIGALGLRERAAAEQMHAATCHRVRLALQTDNRTHREALDELNEKLADKYFLNFSLFQSIPDSWALDQIFPVLPIHRLKDPPNRKAVIQDLTCDSDGRIDHYVSSSGVNTSLPLHVAHPKEPYLLGIFMLGAYQEILGDMHNLFGETHAVNVELTSDGGYKITSKQLGDTINTVLANVGFNPDDLLKQYHKKISTSDLAHEKKEEYLDSIKNGFLSYTYLSR